MKNKTRADYERYLNAFYTDNYALGDVQHDLQYLKDCTIRPATIAKHFHARQIGRLIRKYDQIRFESGFQDWTALKKTVH